MTTYTTFLASILEKYINEIPDKIDVGFLESQIMM
jgi:hypothetical protein